MFVDELIRLMEYLTNHEFVQSAIVGAGIAYLIIFVLSLAVFIITLRKILKKRK